jgi:hypothetical protein
VTVHTSVIDPGAAGTALDEVSGTATFYVTNSMFDGGVSVTSGTATCQFVADAVGGSRATSGCAT